MRRGLARLALVVVLGTTAVGAMLSASASAAIIRRVVHDDVLFRPPYRPPLSTWNAPDAQGRTPIAITAPDGTILRGWLYPASQPRAPFLLAFYDRAQTIAAATLRSRWLRDQGYNVVLFDYRGYGYSEGLPHLRAIVADALLEYADVVARSRRAGGGAEPVVYGWSLGAIVAAHVAAHRPVRALALEAPIATAQQELRYMQRTLLPPIVRLVYDLQLDGDLAELGDVVDAVRTVHAPLLVLHGTDVDPTPIAQSREVYDACPSRRKTFAAIPVPLLDGNAYGDTDAGRALAAFLRSA